MLRHQKHHGGGGGSYKEYSLDNDNIKKDEYHHDNGDDDEEEGPIIFRVERVQQFASGGQNKTKKKKVKPPPKRTHSDFLSNQDAAAATTSSSSSKALIETTTTTVVYTPKSGEGKGSCTFLLVLLANLVTVLLSPKSPVHITLKGQQEQETTTEVGKTNETAMTTTITSNLWKVPLPIIAVGYSFEGDFALHQYFQCSNSDGGGDKVLSGIQHYCCCGSTETSYPCRTMGSCLKEQVQDKKTNNNGEATTTITEQAMNECGLREYQVFTQLESEYTKSLMSLPQDFLLQELSQVFPNATLLLNYHDDWPQLVTNGRGVGMRYIRTFPNLTEGKNNNNKMEALEAIHQQHHEHVTKFAQEHPQHQLIKLNVGSSTVGQDLQNQLGGKAECWK